MKGSTLKARLQFRWEGYRLKFQKRAVYFSLMLGLLLIVFLGSFIVLVFEKRVDSTVKDYGNALWMMLVTLATVGFGDVTPITVGGRVTTVVSMVLGIGLLSAFITTKAASMSEKMRKKRGGRGKVNYEDHFVVCGWSSTGRYALSRLKSEVKDKRTPIILLCDVERDPFDDDYVFFIKGDPVSEEALRRVNIGKARAVILLADESKGGSDIDIDARTVLSALTINSIDPDAKITAEVLAHESVLHLEKVGVTEILDSNVVGGGIIARSALRPGLIEVITNIVDSDSSSRTHMVRIDEEMAAMESVELARRLESEYGPGMSIVGVRTGDEIRRGPDVSGLSTGDVVLIVSHGGEAASRRNGDVVRDEA